MTLSSLSVRTMYSRVHATSDGLWPTPAARTRFPSRRASSSTSAHSPSSRGTNVASGRHVKLSPQFVNVAPGAPAASVIGASCRRSIAVSTLASLPDGGGGGGGGGGGAPFGSGTPLFAFHASWNSSFDFACLHRVGSRPSLSTRVSILDFAFDLDRVLFDYLRHFGLATCDFDYLRLLLLLLLLLQWESRVEDQADRRTFTVL